MVSQMWTSAWKKNYSYNICEIYSDNLAVCLYIKFPLCFYSIGMYGTQCNDITSNIVFIRMFFTLFSNRMISFFTLQYELFTSCNVSNNASLVSARTGGRWWSTKCGQAWTGGGASQKFPNLCGYPLWMTP